MDALHKFLVLLLFHFSVVIEGEEEGRFQTVYFYPRIFRSIENVPYLPPETPYLPPENFPAANYLQPAEDFSQASEEAQGQFVSVQTESQNYPSGAECNCYNEKQIAGGSDVEVDLPRNEPEGYDYPKPIKRLELPKTNPSIETLGREFPPVESATTTESISNETEAKPTESPVSDPNRAARSSLLSQKVVTKPESGPVFIKTLPFKLESMSDHRVNPRLSRTAQYYQGDPTKWIQISPPRPEPQIYRPVQSVRPAIRPYSARQPY